MRSFWVWVLLGFLAFAAVVFTLNLPGRMGRGEHGQAAIQMLDAMRRPFLGIKQAETRLIETGDVKSAADFAEAMESANAFLARYRQLAQYSPELSGRVVRLSEAYKGWLAVERHLFEHYQDILRSGKDPAEDKPLFEHLGKASSGFLETMNQLGEGEIPIHQDIDRGRRAGHILLASLGALFLYLIGLIIWQQRARTRLLQKARDELEARVEVRTADLKEANRKLQQEIAERKRAEDRVQKDYHAQRVIGSILQLSLEPIPLRERLERTLDLLFSIPWLAIQSNGCIFLVEEDSEALVLVAQHGLAEPSLSTCVEKLPFGKCLCGQAASTGKIVFADRVDERHEIRSADMHPHGHWCVPMVSGGKVLGVVNLYVEEGHERNVEDEGFLTTVANTLAGVVERERAVEERDSIAKFPAENPNPLLRIGGDGTLLFANPPGRPLLRMWGCEIGRRVPDAWVRLVADTLASGHRKETATTIQGRTVSFVVAPVADAGYVNLYGLDITDRKQAEDALRESEKRLRLVVETASDAIVSVNSHGDIVFWNRSAEMIFGYSANEIVGKPITIIIPERFREAHQKGLRRAVSTGELKGGGNTTGVAGLRKDGREFPLELSLAIWRRKEDVYFTGIVRDITERKRMEEERVRISKLESLGILASGIAHDFNNILTVILGNLALAKMAANPEEENYQILADAEKASLRAKDLSQRLLTFARGGAPVKKAASIAALTANSVDLALRGSHVRCEFSIPDDLWAVEVDEGQMSQVIQNLIINADQAMPGSGTIRVRCENVTTKGKGAEHGPALHQGKYVKISIQDHGVGIPAEYLKKVFDPYFTTKDKGSGIGLATVYSIVKNHGGTIGVESEVGVGTTFYIYLPASDKEVPRQETVEKAPPAGKGKILIMDDDENIRGLVGRVLKHMGFEVDSAKNGAEAVETYRKARESGQPFDAVILDLTIPGGMGGKEAIHGLLEIDPKVKAIVSSGYSNDPIMADCRKYGFSAVVAKPYKVQELGEALHRVLGKAGD